MEERSIRDEKIIEMFFARDEKALGEVTRIWGGYCTSIARSLLGDDGAAEECVNDTYLKLWSSIPPAEPNPLKPYIGRVVRNCALDRLDRERAQKRGGGELPMLLSELEDCLSSRDSEFDEGEISAAIDEFLRGCEKEIRVIFVRRYYYGDRIGDIARRMCQTESRVRSALHRTRKKLRAYLEARGISI